MNMSSSKTAWSRCLYELYWISAPAQHSLFSSFLDVDDPLTDLVTVPSVQNEDLKYHQSKRHHIQPEPHASLTSIVTLGKFS